VQKIVFVKSLNFVPVLLSLLISCGYIYLWPVTEGSEAVSCWGFITIYKRFKYGRPEMDGTNNKINH